MMEKSASGGEARKTDPPLPEKTLIVGSRGRMGRMLLAEAAKAGLKTAGIDQPFEQEDLCHACEDVQLVIICVPARFFGEVLEKIIPYLPRTATVSDITSVKRKPMKQMERLWAGPVIGTHPLFGPRHRDDDELPVAIVRGKNADREHFELVAAFFRSLGCRVFETSAQTHDRAMARIQNLNYITNVAYFATLAGDRDLLPFITPSFERRRKAAAKMLTEDGEMFSGFMDANPYSMEAARQFRRMLNLAASGDIELLRKRALWWFEEEEEEGGQSPHSSDFHHI